MPQMAPLMWLYLMIFFIMSLLLFMMMNYFIKPYQKNEKFIMNYNDSEKTWKW
uniref:ATP synthase complex subunit 8 n=1 Tax=Moloha majora TaxID=405146 RepID=A0A120HDD4_9EUCA|nr:ATP synthase F0 subunit 8 [Moloha majora]ALZ50224.1 ATPase 8 [Moloha majora]